MCARFNESLTNMSKDETIDMAHRTKRGLILMLKSVYIAKGRRAQDVSLPIDYDMDGPYKITDVTTSLCTIKRKRDEKTIEVEVPRGKLYIDIDYSLPRAILRVEDDVLFRKVISNIFDATYMFAENARQKAGEWCL